MVLGNLKKICYTLVNSGRGGLELERRYSQGKRGGYFSPGITFPRRFCRFAVFIY